MRTSWFEANGQVSAKFLLSGSGRSRYQAFPAPVKALPEARKADHERDLAPGAPQCGFQPLFLLVPAGIFGLRSLLKSLHLGLDGAGSLCMLALSLAQRRLRLVDGLLPAFTTLLPERLFPRPFALAVFLLAFIRESGLALRRLVAGARGRGLRLAAFRLASGFDLPASPRSVGSSACSLKDTSDPTGRLRTTPGRFMVAAMTSGSWLSFAAP
jgi:hypothetical protein